MKQDKLIIIIIAIIVGFILLISLFNKSDSKSNEVSYKSTCESYSGTWIEEHNECEYISQATCEEMGGTFNECGSACRHETEPGPCTMNCVPYCAF